MHMDYSKFTIQDFVNDDYFLRWVNENDPEADKFWSLFITLHPETRSKIDQARDIALRIKESQARHPVRHEIENIWTNIQQKIEGTLPAQKPEKPQTWLVYKIAASLFFAFLAVGSIYYLTNITPEVKKNEIKAYTPPPTNDFIEEINTTHNTVRIHLSDGSMIDLAKGGRLKYKTSYDHDASRHVFLTGEAFFEVAKDSKKPFFVHANEVITKVLGTSFSVRAHPNDNNVVVAVKSGKVSVFSPKNSSTDDNIQSEVSGVILLPNQQVVYQRDQEVFDKTLVEEPTIVSKEIRAADFTFENAPIAEVFQIIQDAYGVEIIFDSEVMKECFITAPLGSEPLFEKLRIICKTIGSNYEIIDSKIIINSNGCR